MKADPNGKTGILQLFLAALIAVALIPSFTEVTDAFQAAVWFKFRPFYWLGPVNLLKLFFWVPAVVILLNWRRFDPKLSFKFACVLAVGTWANLVSGFLCYPWPFGHFREWFVILLTFSYALGFFLTSRSLKLEILNIWLVVLFGMSLLDILFPSATTFLIKNFFDSQTHADMWELGQRALASIWGRQSLAKMLCFVPWVWLCFYRKIDKISIFVILAAIPLTVATTQRAAVIAEFGAITVFLTVRYGVRILTPKIILGAVSTLVLMAALTFAVVPKRIWEPRVMSFVLSEIPTEHATDLSWRSAFSNRDYRLKMFLFSKEIIKESPLGNACIPLKRFEKYDFQARSSHNLFVEQFRERGWIWGTLHLLLWLAATVVAFRTKDSMDRALRLAALSTVWIAGQFDHIWQAINHALILWIIILTPFNGILKKEECVETSE